MRRVVLGLICLAVMSCGASAEDGKIAPIDAKSNSIFNGTVPAALPAGDRIATSQGDNKQAGNPRRCGNPEKMLREAVAEARAKLGFQAGQLLRRMEDAERKISTVRVENPTAFADYSKYIMSRHYMLDEQKFSRVTCRIESPQLSEIVASMHKRFDGAGSLVILKENTSDFSLTYTKGTGLQIQQPVLDLQVGSAAGMPDRDRLEKEAATLKERFADAVKSVVNHVTSICEEMRPPDRSRVLVTSFTENGSTAKVFLTRERRTEDTTYDGVISISKLSGYVEGDETDVYLDEGGYLLLEQAKARMVFLKLMAMDMQADIKYQKIAGITFPGQMTVVMGFGKLDSPADKEVIRTQIDLKDCTVE